MALVWLIGMMGSGKTEVGQVLAQLHSVPFSDTDQVIERLEQMPVAQVFGEKGESEFRRLEALTIGSLGGGEGVVATGGGVVLDPVNVDSMRRSGEVVWLRARVETLVDRIGDTRLRPLLAGGDSAGRLEAILTDRLPLYEAAATQIIDTDERTPQEIAAEVTVPW